MIILCRIKISKDSFKRVLNRLKEDLEQEMVKKWKRKKNRVNTRFFLMVIL